MNRRKFISTIAILPIITYIDIKYKTPYEFESFEIFVGGNDWVELPFDAIMKGDIVRRIREPNYKMQVTSLFNKTKYSPAGFIGDSI